MELEYKGGNCVVITSKNSALIVDGKLSTIGLKDIENKDAIELATQNGFSSNTGRVVIDMPGEYEASNISISGIGAVRMLDHDGSEKATMFRVVFPDITIAILGHVAVPLTDDQLESIGMVDVLVIPVGGGGYTIDAHLAVQLVNKINPKIIIPTHYADDQSRYEVPQDSLDLFIEDIGAVHEVTPKFKIKNGVLPEVQTVVELTRTS